MKKLILLTICLAVSALLFAQAPNSFKYQAVARDAAGNVLQNQAVTFKISILQGSASGGIYYSETHSLSTNEFGLVNLAIGTGTNKVGSISTINWGNGPYFLKVEMDPAGGTSYKLVDTSEMLSVPYALHSTWSSSGSDIYYKGGKVGIGTLFPEYTLDIKAPENAIIRLAGNDGNATIRLQRSAVSKQSSILFSTGTQSRFYMGMFGDDILKIGPLGTPRPLEMKTNGDISLSGDLCLLNNYRVGIGTSSPGEKLEVFGNGSTSGLRVRFSSGYTNLHGEFLHAGSGGLIINAEANGGTWGKMFLQTNGTNRMFINSSGQVGIGTTSPSEKLDVNGNARIRSIPTAVMTSGDIYRGYDGTLLSVGSDIRLKENIKPLENSLDKIMLLQGVSFTWKADPDHNPSLGFIAQQFEKVVPELVFTNPTDGYKGINYGEVSAVLVEAFKELKTENDRLRDKNESLEDRIARLEAIMAEAGSKL